MYPPIKANHHFKLEVSSEHQLYVEECGSENGLPVVFLHGGPGSGCEPWHRQFFDPEQYRIILFDQRGCGRSTPHGSTENNTTVDLIADMEKIREHLGIKKWVVFGGSWGSTLGLAYAQTHTQRVAALIVRGIFLGRAEDIRWFYQSGADNIFPEYWLDFLNPIPLENHSDPLTAYHELLHHSDELTQMKAAKAWSTWEGRTANLHTKKETLDHFCHPKTALSVAKIESHYFVNNCFLSENQLLKEAHSLSNVPGSIIHGRYDMICPLAQAYELHQAWPNAYYRVVEGAGHAASEPLIQKALIQSTDYFASELTK